MRVSCASRYAIRVPTDYESQCQIFAEGQVSSVMVAIQNFGWSQISTHGQEVVHLPQVELMVTVSTQDLNLNGSRPVVK
jgi:hypothetical protein